jgi:hypothetical protein
MVSHPVGSHFNRDIVFLDEALAGIVTLGFCGFADVDHPLWRQRYGAIVGPRIWPAIDDGTGQRDISAATFNIDARA